MKRILLGALLLAGCGAAGPRVIPIETPATQVQVGKAVSLALVGRHWTIGAQRPGRTEATIETDLQRAKVALEYTASSVTIEVLEARLMDPTRPLNPVPGWVENLAKDIPVHLQRTVILEGK